MFHSWWRGADRARMSDRVPSSLMMAGRSEFAPEPEVTCLLLQESSDFEGWRHEAAAGEAFPGISVIRCATRDLGRHASLLASGTCLPVGSRSFTAACLAHAGLRADDWSCYPRALRDQMLHHPRKVSASFALRRRLPAFIKPLAPGVFRGFVMLPDGSATGAEAGEQMDKLLDLPPATVVWMAEVLSIVSKWRYYVDRGDVVGFSPVQAPGTHWKEPPDPGLVSDVVAALPKRLPCGLDFAVLADGRTTLLGVRDPASMTLLPFGEHRPRAADFLRLVGARWSDLARRKWQEEAGYELA